MNQSLVTPIGSSPDVSGSSATVLYDGAGAQTKSMKLSEFFAPVAESTAPSSMSTPVKLNRVPEQPVDVTGGCTLPISVPEDAGSMKHFASQELSYDGDMDEEDLRLDYETKKAYQKLRRKQKASSSSSGRSRSDRGDSSSHRT